MIWCSHQKCLESIWCRIEYNYLPLSLFGRKSSFWTFASEARRSNSVHSNCVLLQLDLLPVRIITEAIWKKKITMPIVDNKQTHIFICISHKCSFSHVQCMTPGMRVHEQKQQTINNLYELHLFHTSFVITMHVLNFSRQSQTNIFTLKMYALYRHAIVFATYFRHYFSSDILQCYFGIFAFQTANCKSSLCNC